MAIRRMFSKTVVCSGRFLRLSHMAKLLYYHLGMEADDDGYVEAYALLRVTGCGEESLEELERAGFVTLCDRENLVVFILDWRRNNLIRGDRHTPSIYRDIYPMEPQEQKSEPEAPQQEAEQPETICTPDGCFLGDSRLTQVRLGKDRLDKDRLDKDRLDKIRLDQHRSNQVSLEPGASRARNGGKEKSASPKTGEADMILGDKCCNPFDILSNSKHFMDSWKPPKKGVPV